MIMTNIKKNLTFILLMFVLLSLSSFIFLKKRSFQNENSEIHSEISKLHKEYEEILSTIDHEIPKEIQKLQSDITDIENKLPSLESKLDEKETTLKSLEEENQNLIKNLQTTKKESIDSLRNQILVDDRLTDPTLVDFLVDFWTTKSEGNFEDLKKMWYLGHEDSISSDYSVKYWIENSNFRLKKIHYDNPYSDDKNKFVVLVESHEGYNTMIVGKKYDGEWKVTMMD